MKKITYIISVLAVASSISSCRDYLDINTNPNLPDPANISTSMILPGVEAALATSYGDFLRITGGYFSEQYAQLFGTSNYLDFSQFTMSSTRSSGTYSQLFQKVLVNCKTIREKASAEEDWGTYLAATTYMAFTYQVLVDCYGEIPYTEALNDSNLAPAYDEGLTVYNGILADLDDALSKAKAEQSVATNLLYPSGSSSQWIAFANTVKPKILMRMSSTQDVKSQLAALIGENNFITSDAQYAGCWSNAQNQASPYYSEEFAPWHSQDNVCANVALIRTMIEYDSDGNVLYQDPRLETYFEKNSSNAFIGGISGTNFAATAPAPYNSAAGLCRPKVAFDTPVSMISLAEVEFFKAEYYARYGSASDAADHYAAAIRASFSSAGVDGAEDYIARHPFNSASYAQSIGVAKWVALAGSNNFESYCELRRLGYPAFGTVKGSDMWDGANTVNVSNYVYGTLYTPYQAFAQVGDNHLLARWPYAQASQSRNTNTPTFKGYTVPVFWAN